jgi:hypothetical protein
MTQVTMPDGVVVEMPDQLPPELGQRLRAFQNAHGAKAAPAEAPPDTNAPLGRYVLGAGEAAGGAIANIPHGLLHAASDIVHRVTGNYDAPDPKWIQALHVPEGAAARDFGATTASDIERGLDAAGVGDALTRGVGKTNQAVGDFAQAHPFTSKVVAPLTADVATLAGARGLPGQVGNAFRTGAEAVGTAARGAKALASGEGFDVSEPGQGPSVPTGTAPPTPVFRSGEGQNVAKAVAGKSGQQALQGHNQQVGNAIAAGEAGHAGEGPMSYDTLTKAQQAPSDVYTRVGAALPEGAVDADAQAAIKSAGGGQGKLVTSSEASQKQIQAMREQLSQPMTGDELVNNLRSLRQEGFKRVGSEDVDQQAIGRAQLDMARALEGHIERNLPKGGDVTVEDFQAARKTLAKNHAVQSALHGSDVDLKAIGRMQRADPQLLDGGLKEIADFANGPGRNVVGLPNTYDQPSLASDALEAVDLHNPIKGVAKFLGGRKARELLTGDTAQAVENARARFGANPDRFTPRGGLTPPPGTAGKPPSQLSLGDLPQGPGPSPFTLGEGANPNPPAPAGRPGDIPLADLLSHGVEQSPPAGLSVGPMGAPAQEGLPFIRNAAHEAGDLELAPAGKEPSLGDLLSDLRDYAAVKSQGVPEGTVSRIPQKRFVGDTVDFPGGTARRQVIENNASGESSASLEAQRRLAHERSTGSAPFGIDPEGNPTAIAHTADAVDLKAPKGHLKVQMDPTTGKLSIMDRGGMSLQAAKGLLNRYLALHGTKLGDAFGS